MKVNIRHSDHEDPVIQSFSPPPKSPTPHTIICAGQPRYLASIEQNCSCFGKNKLEAGYQVQQFRQAGNSRHQYGATDLLLLIL